MKKKSIFVIICCILSALLFISIFVLSALVSNPSTKIDGPKQISGVEKESGESDKYSYVFGSDTVNGEINWLLETDPEQPLASNNISWKKLDGATGAITWTGNLAVDTYNLVLRAAIKDQSLKNAKLDITLKISTPSLTIIGPTAIDDSNLGYESSKYSLYIGEEDVTNDSKYTWVLLTLSNSSGDYESNVNINITANHKIVWNKNLNNNSYNLKLQIIEDKNTWEKDIDLTLTRPRINLNYDNILIPNNTIIHPYNYNNPGEPTKSEEFKAFGINNVDITNQVLWETNIIVSSTSDLDEAEKIFFNIDHQFEWDPLIKAGNYTVTLKAGNMQYLDSLTITFRLEVPATPIKISGNTSTQPADLSSDFYNIGTTSGNGKYLAGVSTSVYRLYDENDNHPLTDMSEQTWEIVSGNSFKDENDANPLTYTGDYNGDIWYDKTDNLIHWNTNLLYKTKYHLKLKATSFESPYYDYSDIDLIFNVDWGNIESFINTPNETVHPTYENNIQVFNIKTYFFVGDDVNYTTCTSNVYCDMNNTNQINAVINDKIDYEIDEIKFCKDVDFDANWNYSKTPNWNGNNVNDISAITNYSSDILDIEFIDNIFNFKWTYQLIPYYNYRLKILYKNRNQTPATSTFYDETQYFYIDLSFTYDYVKQGATILPFFNLKQPDNWTTSVNTTTTNPWIYYDYPRTTSELPWTSSGLRRSIARNSITEVYFTYNKPHVILNTSSPLVTSFPVNFLLNFFRDCTSLKRVYIYICSAVYFSNTIPIRNPFGSPGLFGNTFYGCTNLTDVMIKYNYFPIFFPSNAIGYSSLYSSYVSTFSQCTNLARVTMTTPYDIYGIPDYQWASYATSIWGNASSSTDNTGLFPNISANFQNMFKSCSLLELGEKDIPNDTRFNIVLGGKPGFTPTSSTLYDTTNLYSNMFQNCTNFINYNNNSPQINDNNPNQYGLISADGTPKIQGIRRQNYASNNTVEGVLVDFDQFKEALKHPIVIKGAKIDGFLLKPVYGEMRW